MQQKYQGKDVTVLIIDVQESQEQIEAWAIGRHKFTFPVLMDTDGQVSAAYAPPEVLPELPRHEVPIASNLLIDREGKIQFYSLLDSKNFDAKLIALKSRLAVLMEAEKK